MLTGTELDLLKIIADRGGKESIAVVARIKGINSEYGRIILHDIGRKDYIDVSRAGTCVIAEKGWQELKKKGWEKDEKKGGAAAKSRQTNCTYCGGANPPGATFCVYCKRWLSSTPSPTYTLR